MAIVTPQEYYEDSNSHGNYQFVSLKTIIDNMMLESENEDSYMKNVKRSRIINYAKQAIREINKNGANVSFAQEITVPTTLVWTLPQDYVNWKRVSLVVLDKSTGSLRLQPLNVNNNINIATGLLQDSNYELLFDDEGFILTADASNAYAKPYKKYSFTDSYQPTLDTSKLSKFGEFTIDEQRGKILFSSDLSQKEIVLEYISDGLQAELNEEEIKVHKYLRDAIEEWVYYSCISRSRNVPANEKQKSLNRYNSLRHKAVLARADFDLMEIARVIRKQSMTL